MFIQHYREYLPYAVTRDCTRLASSEAHAMTVHHIDIDSPLHPLAEAEVAIRLNTRLEMIDTRSRATINDQVVELKEGLVIAVDDKHFDPVVAGFIQYTPPTSSQTAWPPSDSRPLA